MKTKAKRLISLALVICVLLSVIPMMSITASADTVETPEIIYATRRSDTSLGNIQVWFEGLDGSRDNFRTAQTIEVKTTGFSKNAKLVYSYQCDYKGFIYGFLDVLSDDGNCVDISSNNKVVTSSCNRFTIVGKEAFSSTATVTVTDKNPNSPTYNAQKSVSWKGFKKADLEKDFQVTFSLFQGQEVKTRYLVAARGINHFGDCPHSSLYHFSVKYGDILSTSWGANSVKGEDVGTTKVFMAISKSVDCWFHGQSNAAGDRPFKVFKNPNYYADTNSVTVTNAEVGVTYKIGDYEATCTKENQQIVFDGLEPGQGVKLICTATDNGNVFNKAISFSLPKKMTMTLHYKNARNDFFTKTISFDKGDVVQRPEDPLLSGLAFEGWYDDAAYTKPHDFSIPLSKNVDIYGKAIPLKSKAVITVMLDNKPCTGHKVQLCKYGRICYTLKETDSPGVYTSEENEIETGSYSIAMDGIRTIVSYPLFPSHTVADLSDELLKQYATGGTFCLTAYFASLNVITRIDDKNAPVKTKVTLSRKLNYREFDINDAIPLGYNYFVPTFTANKDSFYVYENSVDTGMTVSVASNTAYLDYYNVGISVKTDDPDWVSDNVTLCNEKGEYICDLNVWDYDSESGTRKYTTLLPKDVSKSYIVKIDGEVYGNKVSAQSGKHLTSADFVTFRVSVAKDSEPFADTSVCFKNGKVPIYAKTDAEGKVKIHLFDMGKEYNVSVAGTTDINKHTVDSTHTSLSLEYYSVKFCESEIKNEALSCNSVEKLSYVLFKGDKISVPNNNPLLEGYTFDGWNTTPFESEEAAQTYYDFSNGISEPTTLYAHYVMPKVDINNLIRCDSSGTQSSTGTFYSMPSLTISGYDKGNVIHSAQISGTNLSTVKLPSNSNVTLTLSDNSTVTEANGYYTVSGIYTKEFTLSFKNKVSEQDAENYLRGIIFAITENTSGSISVKVSEGMLSSYKIPSVSQTQTYEADDTWVIVTDTTTYDFNYKGDANKFYFAKSLTYHRPNQPGYGGFGVYGDVIFYIPAGVTITAQGAKGADGVWNGNGGGSGIYLLEGNSLTVYGEGTLNAFGGDGADASPGENGGNWSSNVGGAGGRGAGGGGAGIGSDGACGGAGGAGGAGVAWSGGSNVKGNAGSNGAVGGTSKAYGQVYVADTITLNVKAGKGGKACATSSVAGEKYNDCWEWIDLYDHYTYNISPGAGGGGGGGGADGQAIGAGGAGGGGGAGGAGGSIFGAVNYISLSTVAAAYGGSGGVTAGTSSRGVSGGSYAPSRTDTSLDTYGGIGGNGGAIGSSGTKHVIPNDSLILTQDQVAQDSWTIINDIPYYDFGYHGTTTKFYFTKSLTFHRPNQPGYGGMGVYGNVIFYIPKGVTITCQGAQGSNSGRYGNGGGSGVYCLPGNTLTIYGEGTFNAFGGNGADATAGENGGDATTTMSGAGGAGGRGAGGGGAGIGSDGGGGWYGGAGGAGVAVPSGAYSVKGNAGSNGTSTSAPIGCGTLYISSTITLNVKAGKGGKACTISGAAGKALNYNNFNISPGAGGGGGGAAGDGQLFGAGGTGGGAGAGGAGGSIIAVNDTNVDIAKAASYGGAGGGCVGTTERGASGGSYEPIRQDTSYDTQPGVSGDAGPIGVTGNLHGDNDIQYYVSFDAIKYCGTFQSYPYKALSADASERTVTVPSYIPPDEGIIFEGWKIAVYAKQLPDTTCTNVVGVGNTASSELYQPGDTIEISQYAYGHITFEPVLKRNNPKNANATVSAAGVTSSETTTYYSYTVNATLDGVGADIGKIKLINSANEADVITLSSDGTGKYSYISTQSAEYKIYIGGKYCDKTVSANGTADLEYKTATVNISKDDAPYSASSVTLVGKTENYFCEQGSTGMFTVSGLVVDANSSYDIYVDGTDTTKKIKLGETVNINYLTADVSVSGNTPVNEVYLKDDNGNRVTLTKSGEAYKNYAIQSDVEYYVFVNGENSGEKVVFESGKNTANVSLNTVTVTTMLGGNPIDNSFYVPEYNGAAFEKTAVGTYTKDIFGKIGKFTVANKEYNFTDYAFTLNIYTVTYDLNGGEGSLPKDNGYYVTGDEVTVTTENGFTKDDGIFVGWKVKGDTSGKIYYAGNELTGISSDITLKAYYKSASDFHIKIIAQNKIYYANPEEIQSYIDDKDDGDKITIVIYSDDDNEIKLPSLNIDKDTEIIIEQGANVVIDKDETIENDGSIIIKEDATLTNDGTLKNNGEIENDGTLINDGTIINEGTIDNNGIIDDEGDEFINKGEITNHGEIIIDGDGFVNDRILTNDGTIKSTDKNNPGTITNHKIINNEDGTIKTIIKNEDIDDNGEKISGYISGGTIEEPGEVIGGDRGSIEGEERIIPSSFTTYKLHTNGGVLASEITESGTLQKDDTLTLPSAELVTRDCYKFEGWYLSENFSDESVTKINGNSINAYNLYAKWTIDTESPMVKIGKDGYIYFDDKNDTTLGVRVKSNINHKGKTVTATGIDEVGFDEKENSENLLNKDLNMNIDLNVIEVDRDENSAGHNAILEFKDSGEWDNVQFLDCTLIKYESEDEIDEKTPGVLIEESDKLLHVVIPIDATGKLKIQPVRYHNGKIYSFFKSNSHEEDTFYIEGSGDDAEIHFFTRQFSDYAYLFNNDVTETSKYFASITLHENIDVNFSMENLSDKFDFEKLCVTVDGETITKAMSLDEFGNVVGILKSVAPYEMSNTIHVKVFYEDDIIKEFDYSILKYCNAVFNAQGYGKDSELGKLCTAILNYGKYAQDYYNEYYGITADASTINAGNEINFDVDNYFGNFKSVDNGFKPSQIVTSAGASLSLASNITLNFHIYTPLTITADNILILNNLGEKVNSKNISIEAISDSIGNGYLVKINNMGSAKLSRTYTLTVKGISATTFKIVYGVESYCYDAQGVDSEAYPQYTDTLKTLCKAIFGYAEAAKAYAESLSK